MSPSQMKEWDLSQLREVLTHPFKGIKDALILISPRAVLVQQESLAVYHTQNPAHFWAVFGVILLLWAVWAAEVGAARVTRSSSLSEFGSGHFPGTQRGLLCWIVD